MTLEVRALAVGFNFLDAFANYKGVMMCTRPQDKANIVIDRTFCSRVTPSHDLGVNPNKPAPRKYVKSKESSGRF